MLFEAPTSDGSEVHATITTVAPGDGAVVGPRASDQGDGWLFVGMVRVRINGSYFYMPYYSPDE